MHSYTNRPYAADTDLAAMIDLITRRPRAQIIAFPSLIDLQEMMGTAILRDHTRLWHQAQGQLAAFATVELDDISGNLIFEVDQTTPDSVVAEIFNWAEEMVRPLTDIQPAPVTIETSARTDDTRRINLLTTHGFQQQPGGAITLTRSLQGDLPESHLPPGFTIRPLAGESEIPAWVTLHRAAWGTENMTIAYRQAMMHTPDYDPALDLLAVTTDGQLAAYCVCTISQAENDLSGQKVGYTDPIATHPHWQRHGLARALMLHGLRLLQAQGMEMARLSTSRQNQAMRRAAETIGFQVTAQTFYFAREVNHGE